MSDRHRRYREWEESDMQEAIRMIAEQSKSVYAAAKALNIPRVTLHDRFNQRHGDKVGRPPKLSAEDETALVQYSMYMATKGFPLTAGVMKALAKEVDKESSKQRGEEPRFGGKTPGKKWWKSFRLRHPEISLRTPDSLDRARAAMSNKNVVADHFKKLGDIIDQHNLSERPYLIYNADETGMALDARRSRVIVPTASKRAPAVKSGSRDHITVMACVSAGGGVIPPMIVYDRALPSGLFSDGGPSGAVYAHSDSGYMTRELFEKWFFCIFLPHCHKARPLLLILDQATCHLSLKQDVPETVDTDSHTVDGEGEIASGTVNSEAETVDNEAQPTVTDDTVDSPTHLLFHITCDSSDSEKLFKFLPRGRIKKDIREHVTIGRRETSDLRLNHPQASRDLLHITPTISLESSLGSGSATQFFILGSSVNVNMGAQGSDAPQQGPPNTTDSRKGEAKAIQESGEGDSQMSVSFSHLMYSVDSMTVFRVGFPHAADGEKDVVLQEVLRLFQYLLQKAHPY
ncbi:JRKL [Branchiostoma lanceolatum]|uniref:JRKL protein n=1 Tax=Branchiostoma lanceolatum TaxID=7740 RepID=A0A8J9Z400_BRALA|nr:JRKL [Branchiostoma lanceolatum]